MNYIGKESFPVKEILSTEELIMLHESPKVKGKLIWTTIEPESEKDSMNGARLIS